MHSHFRTACARHTSDNPVENARLATATIRDGLSGFPAATIVFFAAVDYDPDTLAVLMREAFPGAITLGCTTAGEAIDDRVADGSVVAMAYDEEVFDYRETAIVLGNGQSASNPGEFTSVDAAVAHLGRGLWQNFRDLNYHEYVGFMLADVISFFSEAILERLGELTDVFSIGGFAGDGYRFNNGQRVFFNGRSYRSAAVLALWKPRRGFSLLKTQAVTLTSHSLVITKADEYNRIIWEFNGEPAETVYARLIGLPEDRQPGILDFDAHPLARTADGEPFLQALVQPVPGRGLRMFAAVKEGTRLTLCETGDVLRTTAEALEQLNAAEGPFPAFLHVNCASRITMLRRAGQDEDFMRLFAGMTGVTFGSYGEIYVGLVAMTSTIILFK